MMNKNILSLTIILLLLASSSAFAQENDEADTGSFYSGIGFGSPADVQSPYSMGMGLTGVSNFSGYISNISNPGQWGLLNFTQGTVSVKVDQISASDATSTARFSKFAIESFHFAFPILRGKLGGSLSVTPLIRSDFRQQQQGFFPTPGIPDESIEYLINTDGTGGVNRFEIGLGYRLHDNISLGYGFSANVLSLTENVNPIFSNLEFLPTEFERNIEGYEMGHRFGLYAFKPNLFKEEDQLSFGISLQLPVSISADRQVTTFQIVDNRRTQLNLNENSPNTSGNVELPLEINTGLTYNFSRFTNITTEVLIQNWSDAAYTFNDTQQNYFSNRVKTGLGFQYHPYRADRLSGFFSNFKYSTGVSYDTGHLTIDNEDIETIMFSAGLGILSNRSASSIDISLQYGIRGTESSNLVKENIWGIKVSLNLAEFMFVRQRFQ
jgi:hypothetical protein